MEKVVRTIVDREDPVEQDPVVGFLSVDYSK